MPSLNRALLSAFSVLLLLCAPVAQAAPTTPTSDFTDNGDGTVTHRITGLTWKRCAEGMTWTGSTCTGGASTYTWAQATALTASFADHNDWRLPTIAELNTIVEREAYAPAINTTIFPDQPSIRYFWSASAQPTDPDWAWFVNFETGSSDTYHAASTQPVRLVRSDAPSSSSLYTPSSDFSDHGDGTVTHSKTGLTWKRCVEGMAWTGSTCAGTASTYTWEQANALSASDWRLPTQNELQTLVEYAIALPGPAINSAIFPNTPSSNFWSASHYAGNGTLAWRVGFSSGYAFYFDKTLATVVRLVRNGHPPDPSTPTTPSASSNSERVFNWGASAYPHLFAPVNATTQSLQGYTYRHYTTTNSYLGEKDGRLYYIGTLSGNQLLDIGAVADYLPQAQAAGF